MTGSKQASSSPETAGEDNNQVNPPEQEEKHLESAMETERAPEAPAGAGKVKVHLSGCRGVREMSWVPTTGSDMYIVVRYESSDDELFKTVMVKDRVWPIWNEECEIEWKPDENLEFELMEIIYNTYDIKGQLHEAQTIVAA